ncbi:MAG: UDP-glucuronic acid decarboxylase family protein [Anaerolineae bacterium]
MSGKRILVTGGAGFLGSHLSERLLKEGHAVICLDNFSSGNEENIASFLSHPRFQLLQWDICSPIDFPKVDEIYNLACPASPFRYQLDPIQTSKTCFLGALNLLELARRFDARIFQASTSEVYGDPHVHPQPESYWGHVNPIGVRSCYDEGKRCAETLFFDYHREHHVSIKIARIFNTYGPRMHPDDGRVVSNFIVQALNHEPMTIYGSGTQTRSFCFVDDLIEGIIQLMQTDRSLTGPINLGNPIEFEIVELARLILELTGSRSELVFCPLPSDDPKQRKPLIEMAIQHLQWHPKVDLKEGLKMTIADFQKRLKSLDLFRHKS